MSQASAIKKRALFGFALFLACTQTKNETINEVTPELEYQSAHFKFHFTEFDRATIASIAQHLENNYARVAADLNVSDQRAILLAAECTAPNAEFSQFPRLVGGRGHGAQSDPHDVAARAEFESRI